MSRVNIYLVNFLVDEGNRVDYSVLFEYGAEIARVDAGYECVHEYPIQVISGLRSWIAVVDVDQEHLQIVTKWTWLKPYSHLVTTTWGF